MPRSRSRSPPRRQRSPPPATRDRDREDFRNRDRRRDSPPRRRDSDRERERDRRPDRDYYKDDRDRGARSRRDDDRGGRERGRGFDDRPRDRRSPPRNGDDRALVRRERSKSQPEDEEEKQPSLEPNFKPSGLLAAATKTIQHADGTSTVLKYHEPPEARKPVQGWRLYVFKGSDQIGAQLCLRRQLYTYAKCCRLVAHPPTKRVPHRARPWCTYRQPISASCIAELVYRS